MSAAASPKTRPADKMMPVIIAGMAVGSRMWMVGLPARQAQREACVALRGGDGFERLLDDAHQQRDVEDRQRERARDDREAPAKVDDEQQEAEQADNDGRQRREHLDDRLDDVGHAVARRVLDKVDRRAQRQRNRDDHGQNEQVERVEELGADAAAFLELLGFARKEARVERLLGAARDDVDDERREQDEDERHDCHQDSRGYLVFALCLRDLRLDVTSHA